MCGGGHVRGEACWISGVTPNTDLNHLYISDHIESFKKLRPLLKETYIHCKSPVSPKTMNTTKPLLLFLLVIGSRSLIT